MTQNKQVQTAQNETASKGNQKGKNVKAADDADMTKGHDGDVNEHNIRAEKSAGADKGKKK